MADLMQQLTSISNLLRIAGIQDSVEPGRQITATLVPPPGPIAFTDIVQEPVSLDLIAKQVVFKNKVFAPPEWRDDENIDKILPMFDLAAGVVPTVDASGVPGLLGRLKGMFPVAIPSEAVPTMEVKWKITSDDGVDLEKDRDYWAPNGLDRPSLNIVFLPDFKRLDGALPAPTKRELSASVTLSVGVDRVTRVVGPISIAVPAIPFPQVLALTQDTEFRGPALILVPRRSGVTSIDHLSALLQPIRSVISALTSITHFAEMLTGIDTLTGILNGSQKEFAKVDKIDDLQDVTLVRRSFPWPNVSADDELSALVYLSPPPVEGKNENLVELCNDKRLHSNEGRFTVATGDAFVALCRSLHAKDPVATTGVLFVSQPPVPGTFGDELNSIRFL